MSPRRHRGARRERNLAPATAPELVGKLIVVPEWRNGRRAGLKIRWGQPRVSSTLTSGISPPRNTQMAPRPPATSGTRWHGLRMFGSANQPVATILKSTCDALTRSTRAVRSRLTAHSSKPTAQFPIRRRNSSTQFTTAFPKGQPMAIRGQRALPDVVLALAVQPLARMFHGQIPPLIPFEARS